MTNSRRVARNADDDDAAEDDADDYDDDSLWAQVGIDPSGSSPATTST